MRQRMWIAGLLVALGVAAPARAQHAVGFGSPSPSQITFQPIDMRHAIAPPLAPQPKVSPLTSFFTNLFSPRTGTVPASKFMPSPMQGPMASPIQPLPLR